jgi:hypothetical protein
MGNKDKFQKQRDWEINNPNFEEICSILSNKEFGKSFITRFVLENQKYIITAIIMLFSIPGLYYIVDISVFFFSLWPSNLNPFWFTIFLFYAMPWAITYFILMFIWLVPFFLVHEWFEMLDADVAFYKDDIFLVCLRVKGRRMKIDKWQIKKIRRISFIYDSTALIRIKTTRYEPDTVPIKTNEDLLYINHHFNLTMSAEVLGNTDSVKVRFFEFSKSIPGDWKSSYPNNIIQEIRNSSKDENMRLLDNWEKDNAFPAANLQFDPITLKKEKAFVLMKLAMNILLLLFGFLAVFIFIAIVDYILYVLGQEDDVKITKTIFAFQSLLIMFTILFLIISPFYFMGFLRNSQIIIRYYVIKDKLIEVSASFGKIYERSWGIYRLSFDTNPPISELLTNSTSKLVSYYLIDSTNPISKKIYLLFNYDNHYEFHKSISNNIEKMLEREVNESI